MNQAKKIEKLLNRWGQEGSGLATEMSDVGRQKEARPKMEEYLVGRYDFRFNVLTGLTEYREKEEVGFRTLDERGRNTLFMELRGAEIKCTFSGLLRFVYSSLIEDYHPFRSYFQALPPWDGKERLSSLAGRVSGNPLWIKAFHRWMLALTA